MPCIKDDQYAVNPADVSVVYKTDVPAVPPNAAMYLLTVIPRGVGKPASPQLRFDAAEDRNAFYRHLTAAMTQL